jgi:diguanylate cyclase (GGDEF)-like protein
MNQNPGPWNITLTASARFVRKYLTGMFLVICLIILSVFWGFNYKTTSLLKQQMLRQSRTFFQEVILTREWIANHGGVYVRLTPEMEVNPYLEQIPGLKVVIEDKDGEKYTLKNPAVATREISQMANAKGIFRFKITSLRPLNPENAPDPFERTALESFDRGGKEHFSYEKRRDEMLFRYMAPLFTEKPCLRCHAFQGYREGDVRGGISVTIGATAMVGQMRQNQIFLAASAFSVVALLFGIISFISSSFIKDLKLAEDKIVEITSKDFLTGLLNRREALLRIGEEHSRASRLARPLSVIMIDIDHFKKINDAYGHAAGDDVLQELSRRIQEGVRPFDIACRYGGEEFLVATPEAPLEVAQGIAERLRRAAEELLLTAGNGSPIRFTISAGVAQLKESEGIDQLISRADAAMYEAKSRGRNQVRPA